MNPLHASNRERRARAIADAILARPEMDRTDPRLVRTLRNLGPVLRKGWARLSGADTGYMPSDETWTLAIDIVERRINVDRTAGVI